MPKLGALKPGPLEKSSCATDLEFGAREDVCKLFTFSIDEVWDYMMSPIVGPQNALLVGTTKCAYWTALIGLHVVRISSMGTVRIG